MLNFNRFFHSKDDTVLVLLSQLYIDVQLI